MSGHGGVRPGSGRPPGSTNKLTVDIKALAQSYGPRAIARLAELAGLAVDEAGRPIDGSPNHGVQVAAIKELTDRGFGKATQFLASSEQDGGLTIKVVRYTPD